MSLVATLVSFGLKQALDIDNEKALKVLGSFFKDHSQALPRSLAKAHDKAWQVLGVALAGDGFFDHVKLFFSGSDAKGFREEVGRFLNSNALELSPGTPVEFRRTCFDELKKLRKSGKLTVERLEIKEVHKKVGAFARYTESGALVDAAVAAVRELAGELAADYPNLARLIGKAAPGRPPLLVAAFSFYFRREVEDNEELARSLFFDQLTQLSSAQSKAFGELNQALETVGERFDELLDRLAELFGKIDVIDVKVSRALDLQAELVRLSGEQISHGDEARKLLEDVIRRLDKLNMQKGEVKPTSSFSIRSETEREAVKQLLSRFRQLAPEEQQQLLALRNGLGKLQVGAGDFAGAQATFNAVAAAVPDTTAQAEARYNAYRAALEQKRWEEALEHVRSAAALNRSRFAPFPLHRYEPKAILGAGGFGTVFHCLDRHFGKEVAVKALHADDMERSISDVFSEARLLIELRHPAIIGVHNCDYADPEGHARPYIVMDYFPGTSLEAYLEKHGELSPADLLAIVRPIADAMQAAHAQGVLHRDLKPDNVLVRRLDNGRWEARIIDFGLALRKTTIETSMATAAVGTSRMAASVAGTVLYAPPEQMGRLPGTKPGPYSDVYAFGKLCCYALFRTTEPKSRHWSKVPRALAELLEGCTEQDLAHRHASFDVVLRVLTSLPGGPQPPRPEPPRPEPPRPQEPPRPPVSPQQEGEAKLARAVREALDRTAGKLSVQDVAALGELSRQHQVPHDRHEAIVRAVRDRWVKERPPVRPPSPGDVTAVQVAPGVEMKFVWVPPGRFLMGSPSSEEGRWPDEGPQHPVTLSKGLLLGATQVTQEQWQAVMGANPSQFRGPTRPVDSVSWDDCVEFCKKLAAKTGKSFRLPTEAEWEYACRAGSTTAYCTGGTLEALKKVGWCSYDGALGSAKETKPVGSFQPNAWGLYDMHGNLLEWCSDWYGPYTADAQIDPERPSSPKKTRVLRGGSWHFEPRRSRAGFRGCFEPNVRNHNYGCRVVLVV